MSRTVLALSPHLDDAAFSCGGTLAMLADAGHRVVVATVFTRSVPHPKGFALACQLDKGLSADVDYMALRRDEDAKAVRILGAEALWLDLPEAPHRGYASAPELFADRRADDGGVAAVTSVVRDLVATLDPVLILAPRAIGNHVDHHVVRDALESHGVRAPVALWTDYPYALKMADDEGDGLFAVVPHADALARKIGASSAYASQIGFQFGGAETLAEALRSHANERFEADAQGARRLSDLLSVAAGA